MTKQEISDMLDYYWDLAFAEGETGVSHETKAQEIRSSILAKFRNHKPVAEVVPCYTPSGKRVALNTEYQYLPIGTELYVLEND